MRNALCCRNPSQPSGTQTVRFAGLYLDASGVLLAVESTDGTLTAYRSMAAPAFSYDYRTGTATVPALTLTSDAGGIVSVTAGSVRFQGVALTADVEASAQLLPVSLDGIPGGDYLGDRIEFAADNSFHTTQTSQNGLPAVTDGTWEVGNGQLRLTVTDPDRPGTTTLDYSIRDGSLRLSSPRISFCTGEADPAGCLLYAEGTYGLAPGTLTHSAYASVATFARTNAARS